MSLTSIHFLGLKMPLWRSQEQVYFFKKTAIYKKNSDWCILQVSVSGLFSPCVFEPDYLSSLFTYFLFAVKHPLPHFLLPSGIRNGYRKSEKQFLCPELCCQDHGAWVWELCWRCLCLTPCAVFRTSPLATMRLNFNSVTTKWVGSSDGAFIMSSECPCKG
jgi:hypothetical protein